MNHTKTTTLGIATAIATVTLALVTAALVSMMVPIIQTAHASCITSPKGDRACSGGGSPFHGVSSSSDSSGKGGVIVGEALSGPSGSASASSSISTGFHRASSHNAGGQGNCADSTCSGNK